MDRLTHYRQCIQILLEQHSHLKTETEDIENELFFDTIRDHYQLMRVGWDGLSRIYHTVLHFDIKDGKIWLQQNTTDIDVGQELIQCCSDKKQRHCTRPLIPQDWGSLSSEPPKLGGWGAERKDR